MKSTQTGRFLATFAFLAATVAQAGNVSIHDDQLFIDGAAQPQLYGAELQYFRLRGGAGPNVPREVVIGLWNQALDRMVEAHMNAISFYIPWDFHEYAEGKFDFTGTVDEDGDGKPDYPSRDLLTFFRLIEEHGIKRIMVRPGPYINAEWGFLGFGAVPLWFHQKYPDSHARNPLGQRTTLYSYSDPDFLAHTRLWFEAVYRQVLSRFIGPGKPVSFLQVDNETNLMWQSAYNHDYGARAVQRYRDFLKEKYGTLASLNSAQGSQWASWQDVQPPSRRGRNISEDQDWYRFQDQAMFEYLKAVRGMWTDLGVREPSVLFTLAESYNAAGDGILPNYRLRNSPEVGMMTVNLYPKTYETGDHTLMNLPFKADHDVKAAETATDAYLGHREAWVLGPEIQGGWWRGIEVSKDSRRQTYLTTLGHGLKALFVYYFNEGNNWQSDWMKNAITPFHDALKADDRYRETPEENLPDAFWNELNSRVADQLLVTDTRGIFKNGGTQPETLYFDAALGPDAQARPPFELLKEVGEKIAVPYGAFLGKAHELEDPVCVIKDSDAHAPSAIPGVDSRIVQSDWAGGLLGLLMHTGVNPHIHHWGLSPASELLDPAVCRLVIYQDTGFSTPALVDILSQVIDRGGAVVSFIHSGLAEAIKAGRPEAACAGIPLSPMNVEGYQCSIGIGSLYYAHVPIYDVFNTDFYYQIGDAQERRGVIDRILFETGITPAVRIAGGGDRTVTFARSNPEGKELWITVKTAKHEGFSGHIEWTNADPAAVYIVTDVLAGREFPVPGATLAHGGFEATLGDSGSTAFYVRPAPSREQAMKFVAAGLLLLAVPAHADAPLDQWIVSETRVSEARLLRNVSPAGAVPGSVLASPSGDSPDYRFHWTRDASLVMDQVLAFAPDRLADFVALSRREQLTPSAQGLGEPRFRLDGPADTLPWGRPQYDGPALRALTLIRALPLATGALRKDALDTIRVDLTFVARYWRVHCFDLWEELRGLHFYTQSVQYAALLAGAELFDSLGEFAVSERFRSEARDLQAALELFWDPVKGYIGATRELEIRPDDPHYKEANLDSSVILAALHARVDRGILSFTDPRLLATAHALEQAFAQAYAINGQPKRADQAVAIGRFTDDRYFGGNPWYLTTAAFAEFYYRAGFREKGDAYLALLRKYVGSQGEMSEQFDRDAGVPVSAYDLSWSYAAFLSAARARPTGSSR